MTHFKDLKLIPPLLKAVSEAGYTLPSPIQKKAIPPVLAGRDLMGCAQTGTGKTAAFALPILQRLNAQAAPKKRKIRALILTPTRELALQIYENFEIYGRHLPLRSAVIYGGVGQNPQVEQLRRGIDILVATPGRLNDLIGQGYIKLDSLEVFVLDEADRMLDMGFVQDVKKIIKQLPQIRQNLFFSATMPKDIIDLANSILRDPAKVFVTPVSSTVESIEQRVYKVDKGNKKYLLASLLSTPDVRSALVFTRTKHGADRVVRELSRAGIKAAAIHGNKSQGARQIALSSFKSGDIGVLVATDIAARGIDINELSHVINYDLTNIPETYVHRIGRTGRAGRGGVAFSFCGADELPNLEAIQKLIGFEIPEATHSWPMNGGEYSVPTFGKSNEEKQDTAQQRQKSPKSQARPGELKNKKPPKPQNAAAGAMAQDSKKNRSRNRRGGPKPPFDPYENLTGGSAIITKKPVWGSEDGYASQSERNPVEKNTPRQKAAEGEGGPNKHRRSRKRGKSGNASDAAQLRESTPPDSAAQRPEKEQLPQKNKQNSQNKSKNSRINPKFMQQNTEATVNQAYAQKSAPKAETPKNENGVFDFSEAELAEDSALKVISRDNSATKYASFEDFLKDH